MKHKKAAKLYKELGKEIPPPEITGDTEPKPEVPIVGRELIETKSDATKSSKVGIILSSAASKLSCGGAPPLPPDVVHLIGTKVWYTPMF